MIVIFFSIDAVEGELSDWAAAKVYDRMLKSANWIVNGIEHGEVYQVYDNYRTHIVRITEGSCTCRKWQLSGLPCGHAIAVGKDLGLSDCSQMARHWFKKTTLKATYDPLIFPIGEVSSWETPNNIQVVEPPVMDRRPAGRPKNRERIRSKGEAPRQISCGRCGVVGHNRATCKQPLMKPKVILINYYFNVSHQERLLCDESICICAEEEWQLVNRRNSKKQWQRTNSKWKANKPTCYLWQLTN